MRINYLYFWLLVFICISGVTENARSENMWDRKINDVSIFSEIKNIYLDECYQNRRKPEGYQEITTNVCSYLFFDKSMKIYAVDEKADGSFNYLALRCDKSKCSEYDFLILQKKIIGIFLRKPERR